MICFSLMHWSRTNLNNLSAFLNSVKRQTTIVIGIVLLIIGAGGIAFSISQAGDVMMGLPDPRDDALKTLDFGEAGTKTVTLEEGKYEVWAEKGDNFSTLEVRDQEGISVFEQNEGETITIDRPGSDERSYEKVGEVDINEEGNYTFETDGSCTLYVTNDQPVFEFFGSLMISILVIVLSIVLVLVGVVLLVFGWFKKKDCPYCGETIPEDSLRCKYCKRDLTQGTREFRSEGGDRYQPPPPPPPEQD